MIARILQVKTSDVTFLLDAASDGFPKKTDDTSQNRGTGPRLPLERRKGSPPGYKDVESVSWPNTLIEETEKWRR
jgi:hypothetical protein